MITHTHMCIYFYYDKASLVGIHFWTLLVWSGSHRVFDTKVDVIVDTRCAHLYTSPTFVCTVAPSHNVID
jgi:hypothetical protein